MDPHEVQHGAGEGVLFGDVAGERYVRPPDVLLHQPSQVSGVNIVREVGLVNLQQPRDMSLLHLKKILQGAKI